MGYVNSLEGNLKYHLFGSKTWKNHHLSGSLCYGKYSRPGSCWSCGGLHHSSTKTSHCGTLADISRVGGDMGPVSYKRDSDTSFLCMSENRLDVRTR